MRTRVMLITLSAAWVAALVVKGPNLMAQEKVTRFARFQTSDTVAYGIVEGDKIRQLDGDLFGAWNPTGTVHSLRDVKLLVPTKPSKVLALAGNYKSHLSDMPPPEHPELFFKSPSCLIADGESVEIPQDATQVDFEAEMVVVIGKRARHVSVADARDYVFGVACGNDISERVWQDNDRQWARAKASDTFGPCGPFIVRGINYDDLLLELRLNGQVKQKQRTRDLVHGVAQIVSWASRYMTLEPGDLIYTGTPGTTSAIKPGDVMEVELEGVGILNNSVVAAAGQ